jgi:hypothetical protein
MSSATSFLPQKPWARWLTLAVVAGLVGLFVLVVYIQKAFPTVRCEGAAHLKSPDTASDCYACHAKATPKLAQDWYESKHGVMLVKCFVCHGQPDLEGSIAFAVKPDVNQTCRKCHAASIATMEAKYGVKQDCNQCHPYHQNSIHHEAYQKPEAKRTIE